MYVYSNSLFPTPAYYLTNSLEWGILWREMHFNMLKTMQVKRKYFTNKPDNSFLKLRLSLQSISLKGEYPLKFVV